jgi:hypothetical protein
MDTILRFYFRDCQARSIVLCDKCVHYLSDERVSVLLLGTYWVRTKGKERAWVEIGSCRWIKRPCPCRCRCIDAGEAEASRCYCTVLYRDVGKLCIMAQEKSRKMKFERPVKSGAEELEKS